MAGLLEKIQKSVYLNLIYEDRYKFLLEGLGITVLMTVTSFLLGTILGALLCWLRFSKHKPVAKSADWFKNIMIRLPTLVLLFIFVYAVFKELQVNIILLAILTFSIKTGAYMSDIMFSALESVDKGEVEAGRTLGMSRFTVFRLVVFPQAVKYAMPVYRNQFINTMQETSIAGFLAIPDLTRASSIITSRSMDPYIAIIITSVAYLLLGGLSGAFLNLVDKERHLRSSDYTK